MAAGNLDLIVQFLYVGYVSFRHSLGLHPTTPNMEGRDNTPIPNELLGVPIQMPLQVMHIRARQDLVLLGH